MQKFWAKKKTIIKWIIMAASADTGQMGHSYPSNPPSLYLFHIFPAQRSHWVPMS